MDRQERDNQQGGTPRLLRAINTRALLEALRRAGPSSRPQLARIAGLSKPTVSQALGDLETAGLVRLVGPASPSVGRTAMLYEADPTAGYVVGIDIGRAWIRIAAADLSGEIVARRDKRNRERSATALVRTVSAVAHDVVAAAGLTWDQVAHTVVGGPGVFDPDSDRLLHAPNLPGWSRPGLMTSLRQALPPSVALDNDANLAAVGERSYGSGRDARTFVYVSVGTGIGMGIIIDGNLYRGAHGAAGEVGYLPLAGEDGDARADRDARLRGILEAATSADAVVRTAKRLGMVGASSAKRVFAAARAGDLLALAAVESEGERLALVVGTIAAILDPEFVLLGGGVGSNIDLLRPPLERRLAELTPLGPRVAEGQLGQDAIVLGAVASALDTARDLVFEQRARRGPGSYGIAPHAQPQRKRAPDLAC
jgi:predicted NBD/HSP70 family sugar kinase